MYALILAGGSGTRLWPHSRSSRPKQFLSLNGKRTMLQETVDRTLSIIPPERVYVATGAIYADLVSEQLPEVPRENILAEPAGRGTAPCIGLAALHLRRRDPDAVMAVLSADHLIQHADRLCSALLVGEQMARRGHLITLGIEPGEPATGYGYIRRGELIETPNGMAVHKVHSFVEKPDSVRAQAYIDSGDYYWNAGMFVWRADRILDELAAHRPALAGRLAQIDAAIGTNDEQAVLADAWRDIENVAIDIAVMERTSVAAVIPVDLGWSDVGDWAALGQVLPIDTYGNAVVGSFVGIDTRNTVVFGNGRVIAALGLEDMVIVDMHDVVLICPRQRAQDVKLMVTQLREQYQHLI